MTNEYLFFVPEKDLLTRSYNTIFNELYYEQNLEDDYNETFTTD